MDGSLAAVPYSTHGSKYGFLIWVVTLFFLVCVKYGPLLCIWRVYIYIYMYICRYIYIYVYIYIYIRDVIIPY